MIWFEFDQSINDTHIDHNSRNPDHIQINLWVTNNSPIFHIQSTLNKDNKLGFKLYLFFSSNMIVNLNFYLIISHSNISNYQDLMNYFLVFFQYWLICSKMFELHSIFLVSSFHIVHIVIIHIHDKNNPCKSKLYQVINFFCTVCIHKL